MGQILDKTFELAKNVELEIIKHLTKNKNNVLKIWNEKLAKNFKYGNNVL